MATGSLIHFHGFKHRLDILRLHMTGQDSGIRNMAAAQHTDAGQPFAIFHLFPLLEHQPGCCKPCIHSSLIYSIQRLMLKENTRNFTQFQKFSFSCLYIRLGRIYSRKCENEEKIYQSISV